MFTSMLPPAEPPAVALVRYDEPNASSTDPGLYLPLSGNGYGFATDRPTSGFNDYLPLSGNRYGFATDRSTSGFDDSIDVFLSLMAFGPSTASHATFVSEDTAQALNGLRNVQPVDPAQLTENLAEARRLCGLSLEGLADLVDVDRRTLHNWANGLPVRDRNAKRVADVLSVLRFVDRGASEENAALLRKPSGDGTIADLIASERYDQAKAIGGRGSGRSERAWATVESAEIARYGPLPIDIAEADGPIGDEEATNELEPVRSRRRTVRRR